MTIMPKKINWDRVLDRSWFYTKVFFGILILCIIAFSYGTFKPNSIAIKNVTNKTEQFYLQKIKDLDLREPSFEYNNDIQFIRAMHKCIDYVNFTTPKKNRVPYEMIIGQAALESGWGTSRFAVKGNNLFGIRTWDKNVPNLLPTGIEKWPGWGVRVFASKCDSVKEYVRLLNTHPAYKEFRTTRQAMLDNNKQLDSIVLIKTLDKFSTTADYDKRVIRMIKRIRKLEEDNK
jgi:Bax protein